jgi:hypothetical protein
MGWRDFEALDPESAVALADQWRSTRQVRLDWLAQHVGPALEPVAAWTWYLRWQHEPRSADELADSPAWWDASTPSAADQPGLAQAAGLDACFHLVERDLMRMCPDLEEHVQLPGKAGRKTLLDNLPSVALRREGAIVFAWSAVRAMGSIGSLAFSGRDQRPDRLVLLLETHREQLAAVGA